MFNATFSSPLIVNPVYALYSVRYQTAQ